MPPRPELTKHLLGIILLILLEKGVDWKPDAARSLFAWCVSCMQQWLLQCQVSSWTAILRRRNVRLREVN